MKNQKMNKESRKVGKGRGVDNEMERGRVRFALKLGRQWMAVMGLLLLLWQLGLAADAHAGEAQGVDREEGTTKNHTKIFVRNQLKYSIFNNYLGGFWLDRPLIHDRSLRFKEGEQHFVTEASLTREIAMAKAAGIDGFAAFGAPTGLHLLEPALAFTESINKEDGGFLILPEIGGKNIPAEGPAFDTYVRTVEEMIRAAMASPVTWKVDGKTVITSYVLDAMPPESLAALRRVLKDRLGDGFLLVGDLPITARQMMVAYQSGRLRGQVLEEFKDKIRAYLSHLDGLMCVSTVHLNRRTRGRYEASFAHEFFRDSLVPIYRSLLDEPENKGKLLGLGAARGYINNRSGVNNASDGTKRLRRSFEAAMGAKPDFIHLPEWNEYNENTNIIPTVATSRALTRILRHYKHRLEGQKPTPMEGDNLNIPNLVLSHRRAMKLGEMVLFEVLNIPDGHSEGKWTVRLVVKNADGTILKEFPPTELDADALADTTFSFATEDFPDEKVLVPWLEVTDPSGRKQVFGDGLAHVQVSATVNNDYLDVSQPLRDIFVPESVAFDYEPAGDSPGTEREGRVRVKHDRNLASVDVLRDGVEFRAFDPKNEFNPETHIILRGSFRSGKPRQLRGRIRVRGAESFFARPWHYANSHIENFSFTEGEATLDSRSNFNTRGFFIAVPRAALDTAVLELDLGAETYEVPLARIVEQGAIAWEHPGLMFIKLEHDDSLPDIPYPAGTSEVSLDFSAGASDSVYHLRLIDDSGKIYRGPPVIGKTGTDSTKVDLTLFSENLKKPVTVPVSQDRVTHLKYHFDPQYGNLLATEAGPEWFAELGGGLDYGAPLSMYLETRLPAEAMTISPEWEEYEGQSVLKFDGIGSCVTFPVEALPHGAFTLRFEIMPMADRDEVLFRHFGVHPGSLTLRRAGGNLQAAFTTSTESVREFSTTLALPLDAWSEVEVVYNLETITFRVNGESESFPFSARALYFGNSIFGGHTAPGFGSKPGDHFFTGRLRAIEFLHNAPAQEKAQ